MDTADLLKSAKSLVPYSLRPIQDKSEWGPSLLSTQQFLGLGGVLLVAGLSSLVLYYTFYVSFILSAVETSTSPAQTPAESKSTSQPPKPIAGSYIKSLKHIRNQIGLSHLIAGVWTYLWTSLLTQVVRQGLTSYVLTPTPEDGSFFSLLGGTDMIGAVLLEPLNLLFTWKVLLSPKAWQGSFKTLGGLLKRQELYVTLIYIQSLRIIINSIQSSLLVKTSSEHYRHPFLTTGTYVLLFLARVTLVTRAHASLIPPTTPTVVDMSVDPVVQGRLELRLFAVIKRLLRMGKLFAICAIFGFLHATLSLLALLQASGQLQTILAWAFAPKGSPQQRTDGHSHDHSHGEGIGEHGYIPYGGGHAGQGGRPEPMMGYDPRFDPAVGGHRL